MTGEGGDWKIARIAGGQRSTVSAEQLHALGFSKRAIQCRRLAGRLHVVFRGVYSFGSGELPPLAREQAALLACGERAFLSHYSAAFIWGLRKAPPVEVEVSVVGRYRASSNGIRVHRIRAIDERDVRHQDGPWVSSPARAVLEIAATASAYELSSAIDEGLARRLLTPRDLEDVLARTRPCRGAARLAEILGDPTATAVSRSRREKRLLRLLRDAGLPRPDTNVKFGRFEVDFLWRKERLAVELDGYNFHRGPGAFNRGLEKDLALRGAGFEVLHFSGDHVLKQPWMVLATIAGELARRAVSDQ